MMNLKKTAIAALLVAGASGAMAVPVTLTGAHIVVTYESSATGLFGTPILVNDTIYWNPTTFAASTLSDLAFTNATIALNISAKSGFNLTAFNLAESGDYRYFGENNEVDVAGQLRVVSYTPAFGPIVSNIGVTSGAFTAQTARFGEPTKNWAAAASVNNVSTTWATATIENLLGAYADDTTRGDYAFIEKKNVALAVGVTAVPEPETLAMMLAGLGAIGFLARRRQA